MIFSNPVGLTFYLLQVARARKALQLAKEELDNLIGLYRKQFRNHKLEFTCVSGTTHLVEVGLFVYSGIS